MHEVVASDDKIIHRHSPFEIYVRLRISFESKVTLTAPGLAPAAALTSGPHCAEAAGAAGVLSRRRWDFCYKTEFYFSVCNAMICPCHLNGNVFTVNTISLFHETFA